MKFLNIDGLKYFLSKLEESFASKSDFDYVVKVNDDNKGNVINARQVVNNQTTGVSDDYDLVLGAAQTSKDSYIKIDSIRTIIDQTMNKDGNISIYSPNSINIVCKNTLNLQPYTKTDATRSPLYCSDLYATSFHVSSHLPNGDVIFQSNSTSFGVQRADESKKYIWVDFAEPSLSKIESVKILKDRTDTRYRNGAMYIEQEKIRALNDNLVMTMDDTIKFKTSSSNTMRLTEGEGFKVFANMYAEPDHATDIADYSDEEKTILSSNTVQKNILDLNKKIYDIVGSGAIDTVSYGIEWTEGTANSSLTRVGNMSYHKTLPIQSKIRGCVHQHGKIQYYLDPNDWSKKADGSASRLDGYDGEVGLEIPKFYIWSYTNDGTCGVRISKNKLVPDAKEAGGYILAPWCASLLREVPENMGYLSTLPKNSFVCIRNGNTYCRGGNNDTTYDTYYTNGTDIYRSLLNKPATSIDRATARTYATNAGNLLLGYHEYKDLVWLYYIEYANFDCQTDYNATPTAEGYKQGGLGAGCTTFDWDDWYDYNRNNPLIPNGELCEQFGNNTGFGGIKVTSLSYEEDEDPITQTGTNLKCAYYRGIQNFFGDCLQNLDRIITTYNSETQKRDVYVTDDVNFADNTSKMTKIFSIPATSGWINTLYVGNGAELLPDQIDNATSSKSPVKDYFYSDNDNTPRSFMVGGSADLEGVAGLACSTPYPGLDTAYSPFAFRTITKIKE